MNNNTVKAAAEDRRLTRMQQMEMMEAAARGTAPSMQLDASHVPAPPDGLRSRNTSATSMEARRFLTEEEDEYHNGPGSAAIQIGPAGSGQRNSTSGSLFNQRDLYGVDQSVNLMDTATETYTPLSTGKRTSFVDIFIGGGGSTSGQGGSGSRRNVQTTWQNSLLGRLVIVGVFFGFGILLAMSVSFFVNDSDGNDSNNRMGNFVKTGNRYDDIKAMLLLNSASHTEYLTDKSTSAYHALRWLTDTDPARIEADDPQILARFALASFYYATHPDAAPAHSSGKVTTITSGWRRDDNWMSAASVCQWYGVDCESIGGNPLNKDVIHFNLTSNQVKGTIPLELRSLSNMVLLDLSSNQLSGTIPSPLCRMYQITYLILSHNDLTGTIPTQIGLMEGVYQLDLTKNHLQGTIPPSIANLYNLRTLLLGENELEGSIPDVTKLSGLNHLNLQENKLAGALPFSIAKLTNLNDLRLNKNHLTGTILPELATNKRLRLLYIGHNLLTGKVPDMFDDLHTLTDMELHNNLFKGPLPTTFRYLTSLRRLTIDSNKFTGTLPPEWGEMTELEALGMHHNEIKGSIPPEFGGMTNLVHIFLNHNFLQHELPSQLSSLTKLKDLFLESNAIAGLIPSELGQLSNLDKFRIFKNIVKGTMPAEICDLKLTELQADCDEIKCDCCTLCY